jgi:hypothetical protein
VRFREIFPPEDEENAEDRAKGRVKVARAYYLQLFRGQGNVVQIGDGVEWDPDEDQTDGKLAEWVAEIIENSGSIGRKVKFVAEQISTIYDLAKAPAGPGTFLERTGRGARDWLVKHSGSWDDLNKNAGRHKIEHAVGAFVTTAIVAVIVLTVIFAAQRKGSEWVEDLVLGLTLALAIRSAAVAVQAFIKARKAAEKFKEIIKELKGLDAGSRITDKVGLIGFAISAAITWAAFFVAFSLSGFGWGSLIFTGALASTIAETITAAIMLVIAAIPGIGQAIAAAISLVDAVIFAICGWADFGDKVEESIVDPRQGLTVDSQLVMRATVSNTLDLAKIPADWKAAAYAWQYNDKNLKSSTFEYGLMQFEEEDIHDDLKRKTMKDDWQGDERPFEVTKTTATDVKLTVAGINSGIEELYLAEGYAVPAQECWAFPLPPVCGVWPCIPVCYIRDFKATGHMELGKYLIHDIFPPRWTSSTPWPRKTARMAHPPTPWPGIRKGT